MDSHHSPGSTHFTPITTDEQEKTTAEVREMARACPGWTHEQIAEDVSRSRGQGRTVTAEEVEAILSAGS
ncbi:hypothetical protein [Nonomuraea wenchangensis]|uniref:Uncharacterized protein n=1 Tax=Nonomuraea wenchangensis TaxID=568860 RepID=A0A1I0LTI9_9ACTN|nr:hypothetical protein [Nonomuraea wenchangensis]SEU46491.1 hypothetical protein SAMN05421811_12749 [Nonomuraea wenchangensis]